MIFFFDKKPIRVFACTAFAIMIVAGCSNQPSVELPEEIALLENVAVFSADSEPVYKLSLNHSLTFTDVDDILLGSALGVRVDDQGRVFIADHQNTTIHLYNPDGTYNRQIGRKGEGPGEYKRISSMRTDDRFFHVLDRNQFRITRFDLETFELIDEITFNHDHNQDDGPSPNISSFDIIDDETYLVHSAMSYYAWNPEYDELRRKEGRILKITSSSFSDEIIYRFPDSKSLAHREGQSMTLMSVPYKHSSIVRYNNGSIIHGYSDQFLLMYYTGEGQYQRSVYYQFQRVSFDRNEMLQMYANHNEQTQKMLRQDVMPDVWPVFDSFYVDDEERIWVRTFTENFREPEFLVLDNSGELLARFNWPRNSHVQQIKNGYLYTIEDDEDGMRRVVKYEIGFS